MMKYVLGIIDEQLLYWINIMITLLLIYAALGAVYYEVSKLPKPRIKLLGEHHE